MDYVWISEQFVRLLSIGRNHAADLLERGRVGGRCHLLCLAGHRCRFAPRAGRVGITNRCCASVLPTCSGSQPTRSRNPHPTDRAAESLSPSRFFPTGLSEPVGGDPCDGVGILHRDRGSHPGLPGWGPCFTLHRGCARVAERRVDPRPNKLGGSPVPRFVCCLSLLFARQPLPGLKRLVSWSRANLSP